MIPTRPSRLESWIALLKRLLLRRSDFLAVPTIEKLTQLYAAHMLRQGNWFHRFIIRRMTPNIRFDDAQIEKIRVAAAQGTILYVTPNIGHLEMILFNSLFKKHQFPLLYFNNGVSTRFWLPLKELKKNIANRIDFFTHNRNLPDPITTGYFGQLLRESKPALIAFGENDPNYLPSTLRRLLESLMRTQIEMEKPITLVPLQLIWDKRPKREKASLWEALFGETMRPGHFRKLVLFFRHFGKRAVIQLGEPMPATEVIAQAHGNPLSIYQRLLETFAIERRTLTGPPLRPQKWFVEQIFEEEEVNRTLYDLAQETGKSIETTRRLAEKYAREIAADIHYSRLEFAVAILNMIFRHLFEKVEIDAEGLKRFKSALAKGPTVLVPNHRSHLDYLLLGHLCYEHDIVVPHVAGGINMAFWPLGGFFRKCGAFFLRRTFSGNRLYKIVFQTYLKILIREGYPQEFFIEGGRSRSGKIKPPRLGMLSMYSEVMHDGAAADLQFLPVSITYDRVLEQKSYMSEVKGKTKRAEKARDLLKLRKFFRGGYGNIYVRFGEAISWQETCNEVETGAWETTKRKLVPYLGEKIIHSINRNVVVTPQSLVACTLLGSSRRGQSLHDTEDFFHEILHYLNWKQNFLSESLSNNPHAAFRQAMDQFESRGLTRRHKGLDTDFFEIPSEKRLELDFFKNTSIHYLVSLALWSNILLVQSSHRPDLESLAPVYAYFQRLFQYEFRFSTRLPLTQHLDKLCCYLQERGWIGYSENQVEISDAGRPSLKRWSSLIRNFLEAYLVAWKTYLLRATQPSDDKVLVKEMLRYGKDQFLLGNIQHPEAVSKAVFENALQAFRALDLFRQDSHLSKKLETSLEKLLSIY